MRTSRFRFPYDRLYQSCESISPISETNASDARHWSSIVNSSVQAEASAEARQLIAQRPLYLDTETTGLGAQAEIIEISIIDADGAVLFDSLVRPFGRIELDALRVHGITQDMVADAPLWSEVWPAVETLLEDHLVGIYNRDFDLRMIKQSHQRNWIPWRLEDANFFCIMKLYARFRGEWDNRKGDYRWHSLEAAGRQSRIPLSNIHRTTEDARLARAVLHYMAGTIA
jgi:DNA polymerase III subunit epsilon